MSDLVKQLQKRLGVMEDGLYGPATHAAAMKALGSSVAPAPGIEIPDSYWPLLAKIESGNRPYVKAGTSSASGLYQFIRSTWEEEGGTWGSDNRLAFGGLKPSEAEQLQRAKSFTMKNAKALKAAGIPINEASLYASHFLGVGTAIKAIAGDVNDPVSQYVSSAAVKANPSILGGGKTVGDFLSWLHRKTGAWAR